MVNSSSLSSTSSSSEEGEGEEAVEEKSGSPPLRKEETAVSAAPKSPPVPKKEESEYEYETTEEEAETPAPPGMGSVTGTTTVKCKKGDRSKKELKVEKEEASGNKERNEPDRSRSRGHKMKTYEGEPSSSARGSGDTDPPGRGEGMTREVRQQEIKIHLDAQIPERVMRALGKSESFEDFKGRRAFTFLHMFSGEQDVITPVLANKCKEAGLRLKAEALDHEKDNDVDFQAESSYQGIGDTIDAGEWDYIHLAPPSTSFDRARHRGDAREEAPVRSGEHIYGYPTNGQKEQDEADAGTQMSAQAAWLYEKQVQCQRRRKVPELATMQSPPGNIESGSAWDLPEVKAVVKNTGSSVIEYNTCQYQSQLKERQFLPMKWVGRLEDIETLSRICKCPPWVKHAFPLPKMRDKAMKDYPKELVNQLANMVVASWKRTLNLEWWRYQMKNNRSKVEPAKEGWLRNEEKRRRRVFEEANPVRLTPITKAFHGMEDFDENPSTTARPAKMKRKPEVISEVAGGLRNPGLPSTNFQPARKLGVEIRKLWEKDYGENQAALQVARSYGGTGSELNEEIAEKWKANLYKLLRVDPNLEGMCLKEARDFKSPVDADLLDSWSSQAKDPELCVGRWVREGAPLGIELKIPVFPPTSEGLDPEVVPCLEYVEMAQVRTKLGGKAASGQVEKDLDYLTKKNFVKEVRCEELNHIYKEGWIPRVMLRVQQSNNIGQGQIMEVKCETGDTAAQARIGERVVLPRLSDVSSMLREMREIENKHHEDAWEVDIPKPRNQTQVEVELAVIRLAELAHHVGVHPDERRHCISHSWSDPYRLVWTTFWPNHQAAPLILGRIVALLARLTQSLFAHSEARIQAYLDEWVVGLGGDRSRRESKLSLILYTLHACGFELNLQEGERGKRVHWIGTRLEVDQRRLKVGVPEELLQASAAALQDWATRGYIMIDDLRALLGRLAWCAGAAPRMRWAVSALFALVADAEQDEPLPAEDPKPRNKENEARLKKGQVHAKRLGSALPWLQAILRNTKSFSAREELVDQVKPTWAVITDATPQGLGALLAHVGTKEAFIVEGMQCLVTEEVTQALRVPYNTYESQTVLDALAVVRAFKLWEGKLANTMVVIKSDSSIALAMSGKSSRSHISIQYLASELALELERMSIPQLLGKHLPGKLNAEAEALSQPSLAQLPESLAAVKINRVVAMPEDRMTLLPPGKQGGWVGATPHPKSVFKCLE